MNIDDTVELDLTFAKMAEEKERKAFRAGCNFGFESGLEDQMSNAQMEIAWQDYKNGKQS